MTYLLEEVDVTKFEFGNDRKYKGSQSVNILYDGGRFMLQTPYVYCPFGISEFRTEASCGYALAFNAPQELIDLFDKIDNELRKEDLGEYKPIVVRRPNRPDLVRARIHLGTLNCKTYEEAQDLLPKKARARLLLQMMPLWIVKGRYGISFKVRAVETEDLSFR